jgi:hypothetical protein
MSEEEYEAVTAKLEAGSASSISVGSDRERSLDSVSAVAVRAVREIQFEDEWDIR